MNGTNFSGFFIRIQQRFTSKTFNCKILIFIFSIFAFPQVFASSNYFLESKISDMLTQSEDKEAIVWLKTTEKPDILALVAPSTINETQGGVIILADLNQSPLWPVVVQGLRNKLPVYGWETLSVQLPIPVDPDKNIEMDKIYELTKLRIEAAIAYFKNKNIENIILIGIHHSANFSLKYLQTLSIDENEIQAIVIIRAFDSPWFRSSETLKTISVPLLDIFAEHDTNAVKSSGKKRLIAANFSGKLKNKPQPLKISLKVQELALNKTGSLRYRQSIINGANFKFDAQEGLLIKTIRGWLAAYAAGREVIAK